MKRQYQADGFNLKQVDRVTRNIRTDIGGATTRERVTVTGIRLIITKNQKEHITVLSDEEALRLARNLLVQVAIMQYGQA